ncbi:uncharacterized protein LOC117643194 isoform X2 [Thrips palmi]|uniref:Uncharacterized protein LOC117643194 isoform X2 n=1 Tax=Thrips palmi TaxID=161013 RepID=A0A6P8YUQ2_THRPL|nr:uncharacterized protein LOC117643194 isoform X2 [Thrips palmi]
MEVSYTPVQPSKKQVRDDLSLDQSILNTPKPQACSTVNRKPFDPLPPALQKVKESPPTIQSPSYLLNAIDGMKLLADQLGSLSDRSPGSFKMPPPSVQPLRKASSVTELHDDRRESAVTNSEANSSLGILKLDDLQGLSEAEDGTNVAELLANFRREYSFHSLLEKENVQPDPFPRKTSSSRFSMNDLEAENKRRKSGTDRSSRMLNESTSSSRSMQQADLRLRLQKALAQRTMDRSTDSIRLSQFGESYNVDDSTNEAAAIEKATKDAVGAYFADPAQTPSPISNATFGAANFMSFSGSPAVIDSMSSENFQSADMAMDRMEQDENSWRQHFEDLPIAPIPKSDTTEIEHLTQNLNLSSMSGIIAGEVTISSSIMEDVGKRRMSAGEYFKLHTEQLGDAHDQRPNFGHSITSPPKRRPHPPLINMNNSQGSVDEVPTRDAGLSRTLNSSSADTLNLSESMLSEAVHHQSGLDVVQNPASRSMDLMPPPPPRTKPSGARSRPSEIRDSVSSRLSMSLSLPRESEDGVAKELNSSSLSLDSGEKLLSLSQVLLILNEKPSGPKSARQLVDELMERVVISSSKPDLDSIKVQSTNHEASKASKSSSNPASQMGKSTLMNSSENSPSRNQRVKEWISQNGLMNRSCDDSVFGSDVDRSLSYDKASEKEDKEFKRVSSVSQISKASSSSNIRKIKSEAKLNDCADIRSEHYDYESMSSFMPPPTTNGNPTSSQFRNFSTPKVQSKQPVTRAHSLNRATSNNPSIKSNLSSRRLIGNENDDSGGASRSSQGSDQLSVKFQGSREHLSDSKHSSQNSLPTHKSLGKGSLSRRSEPSCRSQGTASKNSSEPRPPSNCSSARSIVSSSKSSSKHTDLASIASGPLQIDSTHSQLSWASVPPGSSVTQTFALRNKASTRVRLLVTSPNAAFKLIGERGELLAELMLTLHSEETRRINVVFSPISIGSIVGKLVISRVATSESSSATSEDRRLIALYGYGGNAELAVDGASKDRWAQLFLNMSMFADNDARSEISDINASHDALQIVASFSVKNTGRVPAYISVQIAGELPFEDCGVYVTPKEIPLMPGEMGRFNVRFDPSLDILQWLSKNADDMQLLANIWLSWSELATWQRIRRVFMKYYKVDKSGPLCPWGTLYIGDLGVGKELKDNKSSESVLAQAVRRLKVAVLIERERLNLFDMDATLVFDQLVANETAMFNSPLLNERTSDTSEYLESPILSGMPNAFPDAQNDDVFKGDFGGSPLSSITSVSKISLKKEAGRDIPNDLVVNTDAVYKDPEVFSLEFPKTRQRHKSTVKITFQNPSARKAHVSISDLSSPFSVSTPTFYVPPASYFTMSVIFRPVKSGVHHSTLNVIVNGKHARSYLLQGEGVHE